MNVLKHISIGIALLIVLSVTAAGVSAASIQFSPDQSEVQPDNTFTVDLQVDPESEQISGTDMIILFDSQYLEIQSVQSADYFPIVNNVPSSDSLKVTAVVANPGEYKSGIGTVATVTFKALQEGTTTLTVDCDITEEETSKVVQNDVNATNIIDCSTNGDHTVVISESAPETQAEVDTDTESLPASGIYEDMMRFATIGGILLFIGAALRVLLRIV